MKAAAVRKSLKLEDVLNKVDDDMVQLWIVCRNTRRRR